MLRFCFDLTLRGIYSESHTVRAEKIEVILFSVSVMTFTSLIMMSSFELMDFQCKVNTIKARFLEVL